MRRPGGGDLTGVMEDPGANLADQAGFFSQGDKVVRLQEAALRMLPAQKGLGANRTAVDQTDDRLEFQTEFVAQYRQLQGGLQSAAALQALVHLRVVKPPAP